MHANLFDTTTATNDAPISVLIIDDDEGYRFVCQRYLKSSPSVQYNVTTAGSTKEAFSACSKTQFDCIIVDYRLDNVTGTDVIESLKQVLGEVLPPTIVLTADDGKQPAIDAIRAGACDYLSKRVVTKKALRRAIKNAVEKRRLQYMILQRREELHQANTQLAKRNEEIQRFYHTVSHEVRTPLTAIQEFVSLVNDGVVGAVSEEQAELLNYALESCEQIRTQFDDLLELAQFETGKISVELKPNNINPILNRCALAAKPSANDKKINLHFEKSNTDFIVLMDSNRIAQVVSNLLNNAIKFTPHNGNIFINAKTHDQASGKLCVSIEDTGCGLSEFDQKKVFERLYQVTPASEHQDETGMGLGLNIASEIMSRHNSRLTVSSVLGQGSTFSFELAICPS